MYKKPKTKCWIWPGVKDSEGYGRTKGKLVHRIIYELLYLSSFIKELCVLHKCDTPSCIRPSHLYQGTQKDNARDRQERGRNNGALFQVGEFNCNARFTWKQIKQINKKLKQGYSAYKISKELGCTKKTISMIRDGVTWRESSRKKTSTTI